MTAPYREDLHPRADDGRFGHVAGQHQQPQHGGHTGTLIALGAGTALAGGALTLVGTGHAGRLYQFTRNAMLEDTHLDRVIYGNANLRRLAHRMAVGEKPEISRWLAPHSHTQWLIESGRMEPHRLAWRDESLPGTAKKVELIRGAIAAADPADTPPLYRAMYLDPRWDVPNTPMPTKSVAQLRHGDEIDFGGFSSWTTKRTVAEAFGDSIFHLPPGLAPGLRLSDSSLEEWLVGGRFKVIARAFDGMDWHYHVTPVGAS